MQIEYHADIIFRNGFCDISHALVMCFTSALLRTIAHLEPPTANFWRYASRLTYLPTRSFLNKSLPNSIPAQRCFVLVKLNLVQNFGNTLNRLNPGRIERADDLSPFQRSNRENSHEKRQVLETTITATASARSPYVQLINARFSRYGPRYQLSDRTAV